MGHQGPKDQKVSKGAMPGPSGPAVPGYFCICWETPNSYTQKASFIINSFIHSFKKWFLSPCFILGNNLRIWSYVVWLSGLIDDL